MRARGMEEESDGSDDELWWAVDLVEGEPEPGGGKDEGTEAHALENLAQASGGTQVAAATNFAAGTCKYAACLRRTDSSASWHFICRSHLDVRFVGLRLPLHPH